MKEQEKRIETVEENGGGGLPMAKEYFSGEMQEEMKQ